MGLKKKKCTMSQTQIKITSGKKKKHDILPGEKTIENHPEMTTLLA